MLYEELLNHITEKCPLVVCCIDAHFTAFQVLPGGSLLYCERAPRDGFYAAKQMNFELKMMVFALSDDPLKASLMVKMLICIEMFGFCP